MMKMRMRIRMEKLMKQKWVRANRWTLLRLRSECEQLEEELLEQSGVC